MLTDAKICVYLYPKILKGHLTPQLKCSSVCPVGLNTAGLAGQPQDTYESRIKTRCSTYVKVWLWYMNMTP